MPEKPKKPVANRTLEELLRVSKELQAASAKLTAEAQAINVKADKIADRIKRLLD
jgi:hypothetical protein